MSKIYFIHALFFVTVKYPEYAFNLLEIFQSWKCFGVTRISDSGFAKELLNKRASRIILQESPSGIVI